MSWIDKFFIDGNCNVKVGEAYSSLTSSLPQGSVGGPFLFIAYTTDLGMLIKSPFAMFTDDLKICNITGHHRTLSNDISTVYKWSDDWSQ